jgi:hypothetical protein
MDATINLVICAPSECNASEADLTINLTLTLKKVDGALTEAVIIGVNCDPSETLNELFEYSLVIDTTTNLNVAEDFSLREKALIIIACRVCFGKR